MQNKTKQLVFAALLAALSAVLAGPLSIPVNMFGGYFKNVSFGCVPVVMAGYLLGPVWGGLTGAVSDIISFLSTMRGSFFPGFTLSYALFGILVGLLARKTPSRKYPQMLMVITLPSVICFTGLNSLFLIFAFNMSPEVTLIRALIQCIMIPIYTLLVKVLLQASRAYIPT